MFSILNRAYLPNINTIKERSIIKGDKKMDLFQGKFKDLKIIETELLKNKYAPATVKNKIINGVNKAIVNS